MFSLTQLSLIGLTYLAILFGSAYATERGFISASVARHPATRVLSLGVFAGAILYYGAMEFAAEYGPAFILVFLAASAAFIISPVLIGPLSRVAIAHKLGSLADLFAFRYPGSWVGGVISMLMLIGILPLLALQVQAVAATVHLLNQDLTENIAAIAFCITIIVFSILFGARHLSTRDKHEGLVVAICLESIIKLVVLAVIAYYCTTQIFDGPTQMLAWADNNLTYRTFTDNASRSLLLAFFGATVAMPHIYHMLITENDDHRVITGARWGFPAYLGLFSLCIPPIYFAAAYLNVPSHPELFAPAIGLQINTPALSILAFVVCLAASSGVLIVSTLALASMTLNHVLLPFYRPKNGTDIYLRLLNMRRVMIAAIIIAAYFVYHLLGEDQSLMSLGIVAFVAAAQFLPGLVFSFHFERANRKGLLAGLCAGFLVWFAVLMLPLLKDMLLGVPFALNDHDWQTATLLSLLANTTLFTLVSLLTSADEDGKIAARVCVYGAPQSSLFGEIEAQSVGEMENNLAQALGHATSSREVMLALNELRFEPNESRPHALTQLREQMETNLASMLGQTIAHRIIARVLPLKNSGSSIHMMEGFLETYRSQLTGLAAQLDNLRLYHRQLLQDLPTAVCSVDGDLNVRTWNQAMEQITGTQAQAVFGKKLSELPEPWNELFNTFIYDQATHRLKVDVRKDGEVLWFNLHKAYTAGYTDTDPGELVIVVEDLTESQLMEEQLIHNERLASIGQLAAGVAHEIGNPVTGIACLAQNLKMEPGNEEVQETALEILNQTDRISAILQSLVNFAHAGPATAERNITSVDLRQCVDEAIKLLSLSDAQTSVVFRNLTPESLRTPGDPQRLVQVFINLLSNAQDASADGDEVVVSAEEVEGSNVLRIVDVGHGIPSHQIKQIFEPFFTTKDPDQGTGLGLAIVTTIIQEHHGEIFAEQVDGQRGTCVVVRLPIDTPRELTSGVQSLLTSK